MLAVHFSQNPFVNLRKFLFSSSLLKVFMMNGCQILLNAFCVSIEMIMWVLSFIHIILLILYHIGFEIVNQPCIPGRILTGSWCVILFIQRLIHFANIWLRSFTSRLMQNIGLQSSCYIFVWLWYQANTNFME